MANRMGYEVVGLPNYVLSSKGIANDRWCGMLIRKRRDMINTI